MKQKNINIKLLHQKHFWSPLVLIVGLFFISIMFSKSYAGELKFIHIYKGKAWVIDGDSLRLTLDNHLKKEIRLFAIDAPEMSSDAGLSAKRELINLVKSGGRYVTCKVINIDNYKRNVSICTNANGDLAEQMLRLGKARVYMHYIKFAPVDFRKRYKDAEKIKNKYLQ